MYFPGQLQERLIWAVRNGSIATFEELFRSDGGLSPNHIFPQQFCRCGICFREATALHYVLACKSPSAYRQTAFLIQSGASEFWTRVWVWIHVGTSVLWILGYLVHQLSPRSER